MTKTETKPSVRITDQFRSGDAMVYDLKCENIRITISVLFSKQDTEWSAEGLAKQTPDPPKIRATGTRRSEAFAGLAETWSLKGPADGFPWLDWKAIRDALTAVRAL